MNEWTGAKIYDMVGLKCRWTMVCEWMSRRRDGQTGKKHGHGLTINQWTGWWMDGLLNRQAGEQIDGWTDGFSQMNLIDCT